MIIIYLVYALNVSSTILIRIPCVDFSFLFIAYKYLPETFDAFQGMCVDCILAVLTGYLRGLLHYQ